MLFLLNDQIADVAIPEIHLSKRWKVLGCGDPAAMRAREALDFVSRVVAEHVREGVRLEETLVEDLAALIIAKTGANAALFPATDGRVSEARLTILPETILASLREKHVHDGQPPNLRDIWPLAA
ncbi:MAG TPA: hypothetical protein PLR76_11100 [Hyphomonas sp.]|nr:hypothetical protein [Hyphomonas sp.]MCA8903676.1 hypothetical protein [Hyphomonas sp.]MCB9969929.1 hypothetical protein [Hyphomonas sp.]HPE48939.1 hypothetical protein [Hyphomonas sp.]